MVTFMADVPAPQALAFCRMDRYVLRRARAMLDEVGIVEFNAILQKTL
jgi:hypothetical protein